jgi:threonine dehydrogenase-like Zn-dependent dehydrogenase
MHNVSLLNNENNPQGSVHATTGASKVDYMDYLLPRLDIAVSSGANPIHLPKKQRAAWYRKHAPRRNGEYPITVDASVNSDGLRYAIRSLAAGGTCTSVGYYFQKVVSLPLMQMYVNSSTLHTGISHARADIPDLLELIQTENFQPAKIATVLSDLEDAPEAFLERTTKVVVHRPALY